MKLLLDENLPVKLKFRFLDKGIQTFTVADMKWNARTNGELLQLMISENFSHLVTIDSNISFQQNFAKYPVPVIVIIASSNHYSLIMEIFDDIVNTVRVAVAGANLVIHPNKKS